MSIAWMVAEMLVTFTVIVGFAAAVYCWALIFAGAI
jgi:hypothetical protein